MVDVSNEELLAQLGVEVKQEKKAKLTPREERIIAGFEEIQRFYDEHDREPMHGEDRDIFERMYATRLDQIRKSEECLELVKGLDNQGLLENSYNVGEPPAEYNSDEELLADLGIEASKEDDITQLKHVRSASEKRKAAEEIGNRKRCEDFEKFKPLFESVQEDIKSGARKTLPFSKDGSIEKGNYFILSGQKAYVAEVGEAFTGSDGRNEYRLRVIFDNGVESNQLMHSLQKRLWEDETGRRISEKESSAGPLFDGVADENDSESGTIYILRSKSDLPVISENRDVIHKIGVTGGDVKKRIANARVDPTYLMADVEVVATYELYNINRKKLENLIHHIFEPVRLDIEINDRFGHPVKPREWFLVPIFAIDNAVEKIKDGSISSYVYDSNKANLVHRDESAEE
ncbi:GIY-YIG nuclease family protein [Marinomonas sp. RSW2]|uniref:GIY-YIG nuclease family protein n=1 Tax=Marinomonas maritima TaxID=2940935 RepID=A0ABT5W9V3_9GAMM|nr:GIY-YIG nuclease family protein [Marinomonas maritima]MDE8601599.1 GIY-YIG nuclease family protein [Marinomonas maritima]